MLQLSHFAPHIVNSFELLARGGGGGSGGGGGGGGGGILFVLGYMPPHALGAWLRRRVVNPMLFAGCAAGTAVCVFFWLGLAVVGLGFWGVLLAGLAMAGGLGGYFGWGEKYFKRIKQAKQQLAQASQADPTWDLAAMQARTQAVFTQFQADWSTFNLDSMKTYLTEPYWQHMALVMAAIKQRQRRNDVQSPVLLSAPEPISVQDMPDNTQDQVTFLMNAKAHDVLLESINGEEKQLYADSNSFTEYWTFQRSGSTWLLDGISQATEDSYLLRTTIRQFAESQGMYYSPDWGWLLLPRRGVLFSKGRFGVSDINNHVIGVYHNLIVELYTYLPAKTNNSTNAMQYTIAQVALPKRYDSLIVQARPKGFMKRLFETTPTGYNHLSLEWNDFNKRYDVYATDTEQVTAFELLHPVYMEKLFALPFQVSIEVVDNVVYLYSQDKNADYETMYSILKDAFEEMKL